MFSLSRMLERAVPGLAALALVLAGCGNGNDADQMHETHSGSAMPSMSTPSPTSVTSADYNEADVTFLQMMYPHHAEAIQMADLVPTRSQNQQVLDLAVNIRAAQQPEMTQISALLERFGQPAPSTMAPHDMPGAMSPEDMSELESLSGAEFDRKWLDMMIDHHDGAIDMAKSEQKDGKNPEARQLADNIVVSQQAEIDRMKGMLGQS